LLRLAVVHQRRRATIHTCELNAELVWPCVRCHWFRLVAGSQEVVTSVTRELTAGENTAVSSLLTGEPGDPTVSYSGAELGNRMGCA
jgi:Zn-finger protein